MADIKKNETKTVSHKKVENGYVITLNISRETKNNFESSSKQYIAKDAIETNKLLIDLIK